MDKRNEAQENDINQLRWRCRRGMKEMDILLDGYLNQYYLDADPESKAAFHELLLMQDPDLYALLIGQTSSDSQVVSKLIKQINKNLA